MLVAWAIIALLILLTGLYVAAEFAAVSARRSRLRGWQRTATCWQRESCPFSKIPRALDRYIAASQVGITVSSLILGAYGQATLAHHLAPLLDRFGRLQTGDRRVGPVVIVLIVSHHACRHPRASSSRSRSRCRIPTRTALFTVLPMQWSMRAFSWSITFLNGSGGLLLRALRVPSTGHRHVHSPEEIALLIAESRDGGLLEPQEQVRLHRALRLGLRSARQLMVPRGRLAAIERRFRSKKFFGSLRSSPYSRLPVYRGSIDNIIGILHTKDVVTQYVQGGRPVGRVAAAPDRARSRHDGGGSAARLPARATKPSGAGRRRQRDSRRSDHARRRRRRTARRRVADEFKSMQARPIRLV